ncbi:Threonine ammonia-lyase [Romboutsia hominis]|uniref:Threonine ammonia-lyase n=1 Tax=Romboutsia hominis TaxID=1507512 RepID=A0A2P2BNV3_9FIRM|nr:pyridoxal-phosphate dependent enzyme [Romboutsia hominis]CEI72065.1 Threonine ammonia-lyase [Romboutsia hominis]
MSNRWRGIIAGIAVAAKALNPNVKIIGVQTSNVPSMKESMKNGEVTTAFNDTTIADGIAVKTPGDLTFEIIKELVDDVIVVTEEEIAQGILFLMENQKVIAEGAGAVSTAAMVSGKYVPAKDENVVCVISGGNVDVNTLYRVIGTALATEGRRYSFNTVIQDKPGGLAELTKIISEKNGNILAANISRLAMGSTLGKQSAELVVETVSEDHIKEIKDAVTSAGFDIVEM